MRWLSGIPCKSYRGPCGEVRRFRWMPPGVSCIPLGIVFRGYAGKRASATFLWPLNWRDVMLSSPDPYVSPALRTLGGALSSPFPQSGRPFGGCLTRGWEREVLPLVPSVAGLLFPDCGKARLGFGVVAMPCEGNFCFRIGEDSRKRGVWLGRHTCYMTTLVS